ncbi:MAG: hypothetical protein KC636_29145, partial [Myxococcales bacterium]|nr:hypothetical protein [Myxococcales bacterium]
GLRGVGSDRCAVRLVREGCLLQQVAIELPVPGLDAVIQADFTPNRAFNAAHRNEVLARAVCELLVALEGLMAQLARAWLEHPRGLADARALFMPYIFAVLEPEFGVGILRAFGFSPGSAARYIRQLGGERFIPEWGLDVDAPHPLAQVAVFETCAGEGVSLATIGAWLRERGEIAYLAVERGAQPSLEVPALLLTEEQRRALEILFGDAALVDFEPQLARAMRRAAFLRQPEEALELPGELLATASCEHGGVQLVLGLTRAGLRTERLSSTSAPLRVLKRRRFLGELRVSVMLPGIVGVANYDEAVASDDHTGLDPGASTAAFDAAALEGVAALIQAGAEACQAAPAACPDELRRFLLLVAAFLFEHPQIFRAYTAVRAAVGEEAACLELVELGELADRYTHSRVVSTVELIIERGGTPRAELVREILERRTKREPSGEHRPRTRVRGRTLRCFPALEAAPLLRTSGGKTMTLGEALASAREHGRIYYASPRADANYYDGFERTVVLLDSPDRHALSRLVGSEALESADDWITERSRQRSGVHEAASSRPRVPVGERLTAIDVDVDGFSGQVGLRRWGPDADEPACVRLLSRGHSLATIFPSLSLPVIGALEHPELALDEATGQVIEPLRGRAIAAVEGAQAPLLTALGDRWAELDPYEVEEASRWVMELLADKAPRLGEDATALARASEDPVLERLTRLPAFAGIDGRRYSLAALTEARQRHGGLRYVTAAWVHALPELPVVVTDPERIPVLQALFGEIVDHAVEWQREQRVRERRARARRLPALPPRDALEAVRIDSRGLSGWLWVMGNDGHDACVRLGHEGLEVERRAISDLFACDGAVAITKPDLITAEWDAVQLTRRQEQTLAAAAVQLFRDLIDTHDAALAEGQGAPVSLKGRRRRGLDPTVDPARVRQALAGLLTRLHHSKRDGRHVLRSAHRRIYRQLADTPMFELANHRLVSLNTALEERPAELAHLGFWESAAVTAEVGGREHSGAHLSVEIEGLPRPSAAQALLEAVRVELRIVSAITSDLMAEAFLDLLSIGALPADSDDDDEPLVVGEQRGYVVINVLHPVVAAAIDRAEYDPLLVSVVAAAVHGYFVLWAGERADEEVRAFVDDHTRHVLSGARQNGAAREPA